MVYATLGDIAEKYASASGLSKILAKINMFRNYILGQDSWDIIWLKEFASSAWGRSQDNGKCFNTVTFEGKCVSANELNFIMYGLGVDLVPPGLEELEHDLQLLLLGFEFREDLSGMLHPWGDPTTAEMGRKIGFAEYGAGQYGSLPDWLSWPGGCPPNKVRAHGINIHRWCWEGIVSRDAAPR